MKKKSLYSIVFLLVMIILQSGAAAAVNAAEVGTVENPLDSVFELIAPDGVMSVASVKPTDETMLQAMYSCIYTDIRNKVDTDKYDVNLTISMESDFDKIPVEVNEINVTKETRDIKISFAEPDKYIQSEVDRCVASIKEAKKETEDVLLYDIKDLNIVNYYNYIASENDGQENDKTLNTAFNCSQEFKRLISSNAITYKIDFKAGDYLPTQSFSFGYVQLYHDGVLYGAVEDVGLRRLNVIYIPDKTADDSNAYIAAAKEKIKTALGTEPEIKTAGLISDLSEEVDFSLFGDKSKAGSDYYSIDFGNNVVRDFIILKDSSSVIPKYYARNDETNIEIIISSTKMMLNVTVKAEKLNENKFFDIIGTDNAFVFDIKLVDTTTGDSVTKLDDGEFEVSIPIPEILKNKKLAVYYISDDGQKEVYSVRVENGKAVFKTSHFSVYALAEIEDGGNDDNGDVINEPEDKEEPNKNIESPKTGDSSTAFTVFAYLTSIIVLLAAVCQTVRRIKIKRCKYN